MNDKITEAHRERSPCRYLGIDLHTYLKDVVEKLPAATNHTVADLLPANWAKRSFARKAIEA